MYQQKSGPNSHTMYLLSKPSSPSLTDTQTEFHDQDRIRLLTSLKEALEVVNSNVPAEIRTKVSHTMSLLSTPSSPSFMDPQTEFHDPVRIGLLTALKEAIVVHVPSTVWACLWLSDLDKLRDFVDQLRPGESRRSITLYGLLSPETRNIVLLCEYTFS